MAESGLKIELGSPITAEIKVPGRSIDKLVDAAIDTFSPASETMGLLGDVVRLARIEVAAAITRRAKIIADSHGMTLKAPPLKFLVPFYEKASTEEADDKNLVEMWAKLLTAAGSNYDARYLRFTSILSEISSEQANILDATARNYGGVLGKNSDPDGISYNLVDSRLSARLKSLKGRDADQLLEEVCGEICAPGVSVVIIQGEMNSNKEMWDWNEDSVYEDSKSLDFEILKSLGLLSKVATDFVESEHAAVTVTLYHISELGYGFWSACCADTAKPRG